MNCLLYDWDPRQERVKVIWLSLLHIFCTFFEGCIQMNFKTAKTKKEETEGVLQTKEAPQLYKPKATLT